MIDRKRAKEAFLAYTDRYDSSNRMIQHKVDHTFRVADNCEEIALSLDMNQELVDFAFFLGLLHDIGRFEQVKRYGTFVDSVSVDHAEFGADLLFVEGLIRDYPIEELSQDSLNLLETAIRLHNKLNLPKELDLLTKRFCDLIRDADKVDIFRVVSELSFEERIGSSRKLFGDADEASEDVMACVFQHRCVPREIRKTRFEGHLSHCCMAFELVFEKSREIAQEQGYLKRMLTGTDENGKVLWNEREKEQLQLLQKEIEAAWGMPI